MKTLARIAAILSAALLIAGITFVLAQAGGAQSAMSVTTAQAASAQVSTTASSAAPSAGGHEHKLSKTPSLAGAPEVAKNLVIVATIVGLTNGLPRLWKRGARSELRIGN